MPSQTEDLIHQAQERLESARRYVGAAILKKAARHQAARRRIVWVAVLGVLAAIAAAAALHGGD
jgi:hypothetical protein